MRVMKLLPIFRKLFAESMENDDESCFLGKDNWGLYLGELQGNLDELAETAYVAYLGETPVGYVVASQNETDWMYLSEIYVSHSFRGQHLAESMLRLVLEMNGCHHVHAYVHEGNVAMQKTLSAWEEATRENGTTIVFETSLGFPCENCGKIKVWRRTFCIFQKG